MSLNGTNLPRMVDAFSVGSFDFEIMIKAVDGTSICATYRLTITNNWLQLSMEKI